MKANREEAIRLTREIKQSMCARGLAYVDHATEHLPEPTRSAVIHGIAHGTNTLGFLEKTE